MFWVIYETQLATTMHSASPDIFSLSKEAHFPDTLVAFRWQGVYLVCIAPLVVFLICHPRCGKGKKNKYQNILTIWRIWILLQFKKMTVVLSQRGTAMLTRKRLWRLCCTHGTRGFGVVGVLFLLKYCTLICTVALSFPPTLDYRKQS